jgi:DNA-binding NarL/FixJ family response regulator
VIGDWLIELSSLVSILVFSSEPNPSVFNHILKQRTGGILPGDASSEQITQAVKSVALGLMVFDGALIQPPPTGSNDAELREALTPRETEVLNLLADGLGNREIAGRLDISEHTIKFHIRSILGKLGASSRTEAVSLGLRSGLIEL